MSPTSNILYMNMQDGAYCWSAPTPPHVLCPRLTCDKDIPTHMSNLLWGIRKSLQIGNQASTFFVDADGNGISNQSLLLARFVEFDEFDSVEGTIVA